VDLYLRATQAVFGEGPRVARAMFVGEQPGDGEDRAGHPFVGPAGRLFDRALGEAGIDRSSAYVNAVKHFKFGETGKRRIYKKPSAWQIKACRPWLEAVVALIRPDYAFIEAEQPRQPTSRDVWRSSARGRAHGP